MTTDLKPAEEHIKEAQARAKKVQHWEEQIEDLCRHLCIEKGENPDHMITRALSGDKIPFWTYYKQDAETFLSRRIMNKYYWDCLCNHYE